MMATTRAPKDPLTDLAPFADDLYEGIDLDRLTAYGVSILAGRGLPVTFENVVVTLFRLFPGKFSIVGYSQYPDAARVNRAILHCFPKYKNYLSGRATTGYRLTHQGEVAAEEAAEALSGNARTHGKRKKTARRGVADSFMREVDESKAFAKFSTGERDIDFYDIARMLHATPNSPRDLLLRNLGQLLSYANETGRKDVVEFLNWTRSHFKELAEAS